MEKSLYFTVGFAVALALSVGLILVLDNEQATDGGAAAPPPTTGQGAIEVEEFTQGGGVYQIAFANGSTTLTQDLMANYNVFVVPASSTPTTGVFTITLPATTTLTSVLKDVGDRRSWIIQNENTDTATTTTVVAGTGIDLQGDTANDDLINGTGYGVLDCYRDRIANTSRPGNVTCVVSETAVAD